MGVLTSSTPYQLWHDVIKNAEDRCSITLQQEIEHYLVTLIARYTNKPELAKQIFANAFCEAMQQSLRERTVSLQHVGDQCLLFAGLFPKAADHKQVKINYFVDMGRTAYHAISSNETDLYGSLSIQFVALMDILQSIREPMETLLPLEAFEQWQSVGSLRALKILKMYTHATPISCLKS